MAWAILVAPGGDRQRVVVDEAQGGSSRSLKVVRPCSLAASSSSMPSAVSARDHDGLAQVRRHERAGQHRDA
jgi:hypothetical protein